MGETFSSAILSLCGLFGALGLVPSSEGVVVGELKLMIVHINFVPLLHKNVIISYLNKA